MEALKVLPNVTKLNGHVIRILGQNPGKFTLQGTNTYLVGSRPPFILIDTGEGREEYTPLLEAVLRQCREENVQNSLNPLISDIIITHRHHDHYGGLSGVLGVICGLQGEPLSHIRPRIHKFPPCLTEDHHHENDFQSVISSLKSDSYQPALSGSPIHELTDLQELETEDRSVSLTVIHTPGHTPDSICLLLRYLNAAEPSTILTADSVLGQGTAVFEDLSTYLQSLQRILMLRDDQSVKADFGPIYPGHGPVVDDGPGLILSYIRHRKEREEQIVGILGSSTTGDCDIELSSKTIWGIVGYIYKDYPENLWLPAAHGVGLHLRKLEREGRAECLGGEGVNQRWALVPHVSF